MHSDLSGWHQKQAVGRLDDLECISSLCCAKYCFCVWLSLDDNTAHSNTVSFQQFSPSHDSITRNGSHLPSNMSLRIPASSSSNRTPGRGVFADVRSLCSFALNERVLMITYYCAKPAMKSWR